MNFILKVQKRIHSTDLHHTLLNQGTGHTETNELNLEHFAQRDGFITDVVEWLPIFSHLTLSVAQ